MTFRRVMLVLLPLLAAILVFMGLRLLYLNWEASLSVGTPIPGGGTPDMPVGVEEMTTVDRIGHEVSTNVNLIRKDKTGRTEMWFIADRIEHKTKDTADVDRPQMQFFTRGGEIITLVGDQATVVTKGSLINLEDVRSGRLWGNVVLIHDRGTPDDTADDFLVALEDLTFDNETSHMTTDGPVVMAGPEVTLTARKMLLAMDPKTRRLNTMEFGEDIFITLETGNRVRLGLMGPVPEGEPAATPPAPAAPATPAAPVTGGAAPAAAAPASATAAGDVWRIDMAGRVDARQLDQRLQCETLVLYNRTGRSATQAAGAEATADAATAGGAAAKAAEARTPAAKKPAAAGAAAEEPSPPLSVVADGPLLITPVDPLREDPGDQQHQVTATGDPVIVDDAETHITGAEVRYNTKTGSGSVIGKEHPILMEQPGRLRLTGGRLDFNRAQATAGVQGEGELHARIKTAALTGTGAAATPPAGAPDAGADAAAADATDTLDASWTRGMRLEFYRLPTDARSGMGEIKQAAFHGQAVVKQREGILKGDDLLIDFFAAEPGLGQAVQRLVGHGDVFLKNAEGLGSAAAPAPAAPSGAAREAPAAAPAVAARAPAAPAAPPAPDAAAAPKNPAKTAIGDIACQDLDIRFVRGQGGSTEPKHLEASGSVAINDPQGRIRARQLTVDFAPTTKGRMDAQFLEATGDVLIEREDLRAEGQHVRRDLATGDFLLEGNPGRAKQGESRIVGPHIEYSQTAGTALVRGAGELEMPATTDLRGRPRTTPEPLLVSWKTGMRFEDAKNFAQFDGGVRAVTGGSQVDAEHLRLCFTDRPKPPADASAVAPAAAGAPAAAAAAKPAPVAGMGDLFGRKGLVWVLAEKNVVATEQQFADDKALRHRMEIIGDNLTYLEASRKAYIRGPGRLRMLSRDRAKAGQAAPPGVSPEKSAAYWTGDVPAGYSRTAIGWAESMAYESTGNRAYFKGDVDAVHTGRGAPGTPGTAAGEAPSRRGPTTTRIASGDLQVVFGEKVPATDAPAAAPAAPPAADDAAPPEDRMTVEKLVAGGNVRLWIDTWQGTSERLIYQRDPELVRLYRGADDWARLWQENEATQEFEEIAARTITYVPSTGRVDVVDQQVITAAPKPRPAVKPKPKLVPGTPAPLRPLP